MRKRRRSSTEISKEKPKDVEIIGEEDASETEEWCFVCKDGGKIRLCDYPNCGKSYHFKCVGQRRSFLTSSLDWQCDRHSCLHCRRSTKFTCYCCPNAICQNCLHVGEFILIGNENGFCEKCMKFALHVEGVAEKPNIDLHPLKYSYFKEYYWIIKEKYGFTLDDLLAAKNGGKRKEKCKSSSCLDEVDVNKSPGGSRKIRLDSGNTSKNEKVVSKMVKVAALVQENVRLIYLTKSVLEKLLQQPESLEAKVKKAFIGIEKPRSIGSNRRECQLVQVTGITKTSCDEGHMAIKLQAKNMPNDISIDMVSDIDFNENVCTDIRQQVKDGLIEMPTVEELERMAKDFSEDIVDDFIVREMRRLQWRMEKCSEKGWRQDFLEYSLQRKRLQTPLERLRLIKMFSTVAIELDDKTMADEIMNKKQETRENPESISNTVTLCKNGETASEIYLQKSAPDMSDPRPILKDDGKQNEGSSKSSARSLKLNKDKSSVSRKRKRLGKSHPVQKGGRKMVKKPRIRAPVSRTTKTRGKAAGRPDYQVQGEHCVKEEPEELASVADHSNAQKFAFETEISNPFEKVLEPKSFDVMHEELQSNAIESSKKTLVMKDKLDMLEAKTDDGLLRLRGMIPEDTASSGAKMARLEERIDHIEQQIKQMREEKAQSAEGTIILSNKNTGMSMDDVSKLLEPVNTLACTKMLEEIKARYLPDLDLKQFPNYDPNAMERVHPLFKGTVQTFIDAALPRQTKDSLLPLEQQPLALQPKEE